MCIKDQIETEISYHSEDKNYDLEKNLFMTIMYAPFNSLSNDASEERHLKQKWTCVNTR